jgi:aspartyl-tRNA(Asn)/glutamyl-tRNA(Gln) amidotransferase subunit A
VAAHEISRRPTLATLADDLAAGRTTSRELVEAALARIADPAGEGKHTFVKVYNETARIAADAQDQLRRAGYVASPLSGIPVSIKDLFDVAGEVTLAGSRALDDTPPAQVDAPIVARLKAAGAIIIGRTNMTEFAFSGVGINPHYGTPGNPYDRNLIPGGSSAGAPVSVADGMAAVAIGTDTGGSVRIPAALCGLVGFKPTQYRVPRDGATPLSTTLDSIGPIGVSVACCALTDAVLAGEPAEVPAQIPTQGLHLGIPKAVMLEDLDAPVAAAFERAVTTLGRAGARITELPLDMLGDYARINIKGGLPVVEAFAWHEALIRRRGEQYDPRIRIRMERGREMTAAEYIRLIEARAAFIRRFGAETEAFDALVMPTVPLVAPPMAAFARDEDYGRLNLKLLRNTAIINFLDRCALSVPIEPPGTAPVGLMVVGRHGTDRRLLAIGIGMETVLETARENA